MINPITKNTRNLTGYFTIWLLFAAIQCCIFHFLLHIDFLLSVYDALVFNVLLSGVGLAIWPLVNFSSLERVYLVNTLATHFVGAIVLISVWVATSWAVLSYLLVDSLAYTSFLETSVIWRVAIGMIMYLSIALNYYVLIYNNEFKMRSVNEADLKRSLKEAELTMLKSQLNPHFIFNSLNSISSLTITNPEKAQEMVIALSEFLRYSIKPNEHQLISLGTELAAMNQFLLIEKVRYGDRLQLMLTSDENCNYCQLPPLIIQPLIENAIKYGVHESIDVGEISISCACDNNLLEITVINSFESTDNTIVKTGVGLHNVKSRLKHLYDNDDLLRISITDNSFTAKLIIPQ